MQRVLAVRDRITERSLPFSIVVTSRSTSMNISERT